MNNTVKSLDGSFYYRHFDIATILDKTIILKSSIDLPLPYYKDGFQCSFRMPADLDVQYIKIDNLNPIPVQDYFKNSLEVIPKDFYMVFFYNAEMGNPKFVLKDSRYYVADINDQIAFINTKIGVIENSIETETIIQHTNHGYTIQPVLVNVDGSIEKADSVAGKFANGLLLPIDVNSYVIKRSGTFKVPVSFQDEYGSAVSVNATYYLKGKTYSLDNPESGKVQSLFTTYMLNNTIFAELNLSAPIINYITEF